MKQIIQANIKQKKDQALLVWDRVLYRFPAEKIMGLTLDPLDIVTVGYVFYHKYVFWRKDCRLAQELFLEMQRDGMIPTDYVFDCISDPNRGDDTYMIHSAQPCRIVRKAHETDDTNLWDPEFRDM